MKRTLLILIPIVALAITIDYWRIIFPKLEKVQVIEPDMNGLNAKDYSLRSPYLKIAMPLSYTPFYDFRLFMDQTGIPYLEKKVKVSRQFHTKYYQLWDDYPTGNRYQLEMTNHFGDKNELPIFLGSKTKEFTIDDIHEKSYTKPMENVVDVNSQDTILGHFYTKGEKEEYICFKLYPKDFSKMYLTVMHDYNTETNILYYLHAEVPNTFIRDLYDFEENFRRLQTYSPSRNHNETFILIKNQTWYKSYTSNFKLKLIDWLHEQFAKYETGYVTFSRSAHVSYFNPYL